MTSILGGRKGVKKDFLAQGILLRAMNKQCDLHDDVMNKS